jgi:hypothetical protein
MVRVRVRVRVRAWVSWCENAMDNPSTSSYPLFYRFEPSPQSVNHLPNNNDSSYNIIFQNNNHVALSSLF